MRTDDSWLTGASAIWSKQIREAERELASNVRIQWTMDHGTKSKTTKGPLKGLKAHK
jgi:hypothetical protein